MRRSSSSLACLVVGSSAALPAQQDLPDGATVLRDVRVETRNVFSDEEADENWLYRFLNALHFTTDPEVLRRELWFGPDDRVTADQIEELERNLRRLRLFGEVNTVLADAGDGRSDLLVQSRDRFSLVVQGGVSTVGGVSSFDAAIGDLNLFGTGKRLVARFEEEDDDRSASLRYSDPQLLGTRHRLDLEVGDADEGPFASFNLRRPFRHLADPWSYGASASTVEQRIDFFQSGETVAEVPEDRVDTRLFGAHALGPRLLRGHVGVETRLRSSELEPAIGPAAATIRVPGDTVEAQLGAFVAVDAIDEYRKVQGLDAIDFDEDLQLGTSWDFRGAAVVRDEDGRSTQFQQVIEGGLRSAVAPLPDTFFTVELGGGLRWRGHRALGWRTTAALHAFQMSLPHQTLAASWTYDQVLERQDLPPQLTLGEDNGLRGYPAREFSGTRVARLNLEDRIRTPVEILSVHVGIAAFFDVGWVHGSRSGLSMGEALRSAGVGLRLGSSELFGDNIVRIDVGFPLDEVNGEGFDVSVSAAAGQVFGFFGNRRELSSEFEGFLR